jgi:hypothetical protein
MLSKIYPPLFSFISTCLLCYLIGLFSYAYASDTAINADFPNTRTSTAHSSSLGALDPLPAEVQLHIFSFLDYKDLFRVDLVSKRALSVSNDETLWKPILATLQKNLIAPFPFKEPLSPKEQVKTIITRKSLIYFDNHTAETLTIKIWMSFKSESETVPEILFWVGPFSISAQQKLILKDIHLPPEALPISSFDQLQELFTTGNMQAEALRLIYISNNDKSWLATDSEGCLTFSLLKSAPVKIMLSKDMKGNYLVDPRLK